MATVRYIVNDVEAAIGFYTGLLGFELKRHTRWLVAAAGTAAKRARPGADSSG